MFRLLGRIPKTHFHVACSGGSDSMVVVDFLRKYPKNKFDILYFDHGTQCCREAFEFLTEYCGRTVINLITDKISRSRFADESQEEYWRKCRYDFFGKYSDEPIVMCHHLNDCIETWIMTSMAGNPQLIPYRNEKYNIIRPFLAVSKSQIVSWSSRNNVEYVYDRSNSDTSIRRNYVRHVMMEHVKAINPGIETTIRRKILENYRSTDPAVT